MPGFNRIPVSPFIKKHDAGLVALAFFLGNFILKIIFITGNEIALDEPFSIFYAQMDLSSICTMLRTENNPALHFFLLHFWIKLFGIGPLSVRFLSVIFSSVTASVIYLTGRKFYTLRTGILGGMIFTLSQFQVYYSHEARVYPLFVMLTALSLYYFLSLIARPEKWKYAFALFTANALLIYAHYFGFFVLIAELACVFMNGNFRRIWRKMIVLFPALFLAYIPNIIVFATRFSDSVKHGTWVKKPEFSELYGNLNRFLNSRTTMYVLIGIVFFYLILLIYNKELRARLSGFFKNRSSAILITWFAFPYLVMFLVSYRVPMFLDRYIIFTSVSFYLLIAVFITTFTGYKVVSFASSLLLLTAMFVTLRLNPDNNRRVDRVVHAVLELKKKDPTAAVIISPYYTYLEFTYHYSNRYFKQYAKTMALLNADHIYPLNDFSAFGKAGIAGKKVIYVDSGTDFAFGKNDILDELRASHDLVTCIPVFEIYRIYWFRPRHASQITG